MNKEVIVKADKIYKRKKRVKRVKIISLIVFILMTISFLVLSIIYKGGRFVITLDNALALQSGIILYDNAEEKEAKRRLYADEIHFMDNIAMRWIPTNIHSRGGGSHNGDSYIAYNFYVENGGTRNINYWYELIIDDVIKNVDEAIRIMIIKNDEKVVYAKMNSHTKEPEPNTAAFYSQNDESAILESRRDFKPKDVDKFSIIIWLDGDDPDCVNALIGGEIKLHMNIREEHIEN